MPTTTSPAFDAAAIAIYALVLLVPGVLVGYAAGLRGWILAAMAPLLTYAVGGLTGPWLHALGIPFGIGSFLLALVLFVAVAAGVRWLSRRGRWARPEEPHVPWARTGHLAVLGCVVLASVVGGYVVLTGLVQLGAISQGFDAVYHANGIRYIAETGDGSVTGMGTTNWFDAEIFYPNAYHLVAAVDYQIGTASIPVVLNTNTLLIPGMLALSFAGLVRQFRGRAVLAGASAILAVVPTAALYESMDRGPLLPFLVGLALTPLGAVALQRYLARPALDSGLVFVLAAVGLLTVHSSTLFAGILFALPMLAQRWIVARGHRLRTMGRDGLALLAAAVASVLVAWSQLFGALGLAGGDIPYLGWDSEAGLPGAIGNLLTFQHAVPTPQLATMAALVLGIAFVRRLGALRWVAATAVLCGTLYVAVATSDSAFVMALSRPWWDDPFRFVAMATVPLCLLAAHGLAESQAWARDRLALARPFAGGRIPRAPVAAALAVVVLGGYAVASNGLYTRTNAKTVYDGYHEGPGTDVYGMVVSPGEAQAMLELGKRAQPGDWAMNDRYDGTAWTYAIGGVRTVAGHFDGSLVPWDAAVLGARFRDYDWDPDVQETVARLNVRWVIVGRGGHPLDSLRETGVRDLDGLPFIELVYRNDDASVYRVDRIFDPGTVVPAGAPARAYGPLPAP
ncbi:hypothetical protein CFN78_10170 [Amycolatopsis antarctica]|uniref:Copper-transporting ATPase n=1 Tax=Amycolatopsis antarctica TaxID=1854586 RepID=A0A263D784_9PSEU|nr:DUF6541 family protein [Amycolatopsis antarctica]OZM73437.1 hypothetical protein CFN78_10170 [Amycolatopsis antarctica]